MKILHIADTHLGYSAYRKITEDGINQREQDAYNSFKQFIDYALESKPDLIIHAGDLFDSVRPTNRAITFAIQQILRLSNQKLPFIVLAGNHEHPKLKETGHIFSIFDHINHMYPVYKAKYETISFNFKNEKLIVHAIPQCTTKKEYNNNLKKLKPDSSADYNIFTTHGSVQSIKEFSMNEFNELIIPTTFLKLDFDYIALGHYHKYTKIFENTYYVGSPERFTFADAGEPKGFIELELKTKLKHKFIPLSIRPMIDAEPINCSKLSIGEIMDKIKKTIKKIEPNGKIIRITLNKIPTHTNRGIDFRIIRELTKEAVHYEIKADILKEDKSKTYGTTKIDALAKEFKLFLRKQDIEEKNMLLKLGMKYIEKIERKEEGK